MRWPNATLRQLSKGSRLARQHEPSFRISLIAFPSSSISSSSLLGFSSVLRPQHHLMGPVRSCFRLFHLIESSFRSQKMRKSSRSLRLALINRDQFSLLGIDSVGNASARRGKRNLSPSKAGFVAVFPQRESEISPSSRFLPTLHLPSLSLHLSLPSQARPPIYLEATASNLEIESRASFHLSAMSESASIATGKLLSFSLFPFTKDAREITTERTCLYRAT